jgi:hypothetical protein
MGSPLECTACHSNQPPVAVGLDRLARVFETVGLPRPAAVMVPLAVVLAPEAVSSLPELVVAFYADPTRFRVRARLEASSLSRVWLGLFARITRQSLPILHGDTLPEFGVCQWLYRDQRGYVHWDRYACVEGALERLFVARMGYAPGVLRETFVVYGLPITVAFRARVENGALLLTSIKTLQNPLSWFARVTYRTELAENGLATRGDFQVPLFGVRVGTAFLIDRPSAPRHDSHATRISRVPAR